MPGRANAVHGCQGSLKVAKVAGTFRLKFCSGFSAARSAIHNSGVLNTPTTQRHAFAFAAVRRAGSRLAVWLSLLAIFSALVAPASMLAEEVRTGKLGGLCSVQSRIDGALSAGDEAALSPAAHCDWCASPAFSMPPPIRGVFAPVVASVFSVLASSGLLPDLAPVGLPFSRGPPRP